MTIDPQTERWKLVSEENQRLQNELNDMHSKFETLNTRNDSLFIFYDVSSVFFRNTTIGIVHDDKWTIEFHRSSTACLSQT